MARRQVAAGRPDDGQVRQRIAPDDLEPELVAVDERGRSPFRAGDDVGVGHQVPVRRERHAPSRHRRPSRRLARSIRRLATDGMSRAAAVLTAAE